MADTKISAETDAGTLTGAEIVPVVRPSGSPPAYSNLRTTAQAIADLRASVATQTGTGLTTQSLRTSVTVGDTAGGILITAPSAGVNDAWSYISKARPATPWSVVAEIAVATAGSAAPSGDKNIGIGFHDGTKLQMIRLFQTATTAGQHLIVSSYTNVTTWSANINTSWFASAPTVFLKIRHDGTTVYFMAGADGVNFATIYSIAAGSGFLGSTGYSNVFFGCATNGEQMLATLKSWTEGT